MQLNLLNYLKLCLFSISVSEYRILLYYKYNENVNYTILIRMNIQIIIYTL